MTQTHSRSRNPGKVDSGLLGWSPIDIGNLKIWNDATKDCFLDGDNMSPLRDYSGNGNKANAIATVTYKTAIKNGLSVYRMGTSSYQYVSTSIPSGSFTFVIAINPTDTSGAKYIFDSSAGRFIIALRAFGSELVGWFDGAWNGIAASSTGWQILAWVLTSGGNGEVFRNGASLGAAAYSAKAIGGTTRIFSEYTGGAGFFSNGDMGEFLVFDKALSSGELSALTGYLNAKWNIF